MQKNYEAALLKARAIKLAIFDVDGVLTDGKIYFTSDGIEYKAFHSHDGLGLKMLMKAGIEVAIITGRKSLPVTRRMEELGVRYVFQGQDNKLESYDYLKNTLHLSDDQIAYTGDDLNDLGPIRRCGLPIAVANATPVLLQYASWVTTRPGGAGAVREVCEFLLTAQEAFEPICEQFS